MDERYDSWNKIKKNTNQGDFFLTIKPREIYWVKLGQNIGDEEYGKGENFSRPVIVIKKLTRGLFLGIPTTTKVKESNDYFYPFEYKDKNTNLLKVSAMILQVKVFSTKRVMNKIGVMNKEDFKKTQEKLKSLVGPT